MQKILATLIGTALAIGLAFANANEAAAQTPKELVARFMASGNDPTQAMSLAKNFAPDAVHEIALIMGHGLKDEHMRYPLSSWSHRDNWRKDPEVAKLLMGYSETSHSTPEILVEQKDGTAIVTAVQNVSFNWKKHAGEMKLTNRFHILDRPGAPMVTRLETVFDYR